MGSVQEESITTHVRDHCPSHIKQDSWLTESFMPNDKTIMSSKSSITHQRTFNPSFSRSVVMVSRGQKEKNRKSILIPKRMLSLESTKQALIFNSASGGSNVY